jgi:hypothetical protein
MPTETLLRIPISVICGCFQCRPLIGCRGQSSNIYLSQDSFLYDLVRSQAASCMQFQGQTAALGSPKRVSERISKKQ